MHPAWIIIISVVISSIVSILISKFLCNSLEYKLEMNRHIRELKEQKNCELKERHNLETIISAILMYPSDNGTLNEKPVDDNLDDDSSTEW